MTDQIDGQIHTLINIILYVVNELKVFCELLLFVRHDRAQRLLHGKCGEAESLTESIEKVPVIVRMISDRGQKEQ